MCQPGSNGPFIRHSLIYSTDRRASDFDFYSSNRFSFVVNAETFARRKKKKKLTLFVATKAKADPANLENNPPTFILEGLPRFYSEAGFDIFETSSSISNSPRPVIRVVSSRFRKNIEDGGAAVEALSQTASTKRKTVQKWPGFDIGNDRAVVRAIATKEDPHILNY